MKTRTAKKITNEAYRGFNRPNVSVYYAFGNGRAVERKDAYSMAQWEKALIVMARAILRRTRMEPKVDSNGLLPTRDALLLRLNAMHPQRFWHQDGVTHVSSQDEARIAMITGSAPPSRSHRSRDRG